LENIVAMVQTDRTKDRRRIFIRRQRHSIKHHDNSSQIGWIKIKIYKVAKKCLVLYL